jgi:hypothetical protein
MVRKQKTMHHGTRSADSMSLYSQVIRSVAVALSVSLASANCPTEVKVPGPNNAGCFTYDLSGMSNATFTVNDTWPEPYLVAAPCHDADTSACASCNGKSHGVSCAYQVLCDQDRCFSLNDNGGGSATATPNADPKTGLTVLLTGGDAGRIVTVGEVALLRRSRTRSSPECRRRPRSYSRPC